MRRERLVWPTLLALWLAPSSAYAYCRTTTCDAGGNAKCAVDANGCTIVDPQNKIYPLYWPMRCLGFAVQKDGSPKLGITAADADAPIKLAFEQWQGASCGGPNPSFTIFDEGDGIVCNRPQYNSDPPNTNVWMFRDTDWPYVGATTTLALTTVTFGVTSGKILDADVELNSFGTHFVTTNFGPGTDLQSIATHESGHFLGLAHSNVLGATMYPQYASGDRSFRSLSADDVAGICDVYPPNRDVATCSTPPPFSVDCGGGNTSSTSGGTTCKCELGANRAPGGTAAALLAALALAVGRRRRKH